MSKSWHLSAFPESGPVDDEWHDTPGLDRFVRVAVAVVARCTETLTELDPADRPGKTVRVFPGEAPPGGSEVLIEVQPTPGVSWEMITVLLPESANGLTEAQVRHLLIEVLRIGMSSLAELRRHPWEVMEEALTLAVQRGFPYVRYGRLRSAPNRSTKARLIHLIRGDGMFHTNLEVRSGEQVRWYGPEMAVGVSVGIRESERTLSWLDNDSVQFVVDGLFDSARVVTYRLDEEPQTGTPPWEPGDELDDDYDIPLVLLEKAGPKLLTVETLTVPDRVPTEYAAALAGLFEMMQTELQSWWRVRSRGLPLRVRVCWEAGKTSVEMTDDAPAELVATLHRNVDDVPAGQAGDKAARADFAELIAALEHPHH